MNLLPSTILIAYLPLNPKLQLSGGPPPSPPPPRSCISVRWSWTHHLAVWTEVCARLSSAIIRHLANTTRNPEWHQEKPARKEGRYISKAKYTTCVHLDPTTRAIFTVFMTRKIERVGDRDSVCVCVCVCVWHRETGGQRGDRNRNRETKKEAETEKDRESAYTCVQSGRRDEKSNARVIYLWSSINLWRFEWQRPPHIGTTNNRS